MLNKERAGLKVRCYALVRVWLGDQNLPTLFLSFSTQEECDAICVRGTELQVPDSSATERPGEFMGPGMVKYKAGLYCFDS